MLQPLSVPTFRPACSSPYRLLRLPSAADTRLFTKSKGPLKIPTTQQIGNCQRPRGGCLIKEFLGFSWYHQKGQAGDFLNHVCLQIQESLKLEVENSGCLRSVSSLGSVNDFLCSWHNPVQFHLPLSQTIHSHLLLACPCIRLRATSSLPFFLCASKRGRGMGEKAHKPSLLQVHYFFSFPTRSWLIAQRILASPNTRSPPQSSNVCREAF